MGLRLAQHDLQVGGPVADQALEVTGEGLLVGMVRGVGRQAPAGAVVVGAWVTVVPVTDGAVVLDWITLDHLMAGTVSPHIRTTVGNLQDGERTQTCKKMNS